MATTGRRRRPRRPRRRRRQRRRNPQQLGKFFHRGQLEMRTMQAHNPHVYHQFTHNLVFFLISFLSVFLCFRCFSSSSPNLSLRGLESFPTHFSFSQPLSFTKFSSPLSPIFGSKSPIIQETDFLSLEHSSRSNHNSTTTSSETNQHPSTTFIFAGLSKVSLYIDGVLITSTRSQTDIQKVTVTMNPDSVIAFHALGPTAGIVATIKNTSGGFMWTGDRSGRWRLQSVNSSREPSSSYFRWMLLSHLDVCGWEPPLPIESSSTDDPVATYVWAGIDRQGDAVILRAMMQCAVSGTESQDENGGGSSVVLRIPQLLQNILTTTAGFDRKNSPVHNAEVFAKDFFTSLSDMITTFIQKILLQYSIIRVDLVDFTPILSESNFETLFPPVDDAVSATQMNVVDSTLFEVVSPTTKRNTYEFVKSRRTTSEIEDGNESSTRQQVFTSKKEQRLGEKIRRTTRKAERRWLKFQLLGSHRQKSTQQKLGSNRQVQEQNRNRIDISTTAPTARMGAVPTDCFAQQCGTRVSVRSERGLRNNIVRQAIENLRKLPNFEDIYNTDERAGGTFIIRKSGPFTFAVFVPFQKQYLLEIR